MNNVAATLNISHGSAQHIIHNMLQCHEVSKRWAPKQLSPELKVRWVECLPRNYMTWNRTWQHP